MWRKSHSAEWEPFFVDSPPRAQAKDCADGHGLPILRAMGRCDLREHFAATFRDSRLAQSRRTAVRVGGWFRVVLREYLSCTTAPKLAATLPWCAGFCVVDVDSSRSGVRHADAPRRSSFPVRLETTGWNAVLRARWNAVLRARSDVRGAHDRSSVRGILASSGLDFYRGWFHLCVHATN